MAVTSPDSLRTPNPGDPYNLVADLAILAQDTQDALTRRANVFSGTVSQRTAFTSTATNGMLWQDTDGIKMIWRKDGAAWVPAVWRWSGTSAQRAGFTQAPNGFEWFSTTDNAGYVRMGGAWTVNVSPWTSLGLPAWGTRVPLSWRRENGGIRYYGGAAVSNGSSMWTVPSDIRPSDQARLLDSGSDSGARVVLISGSTGNMGFAVPVGSTTVFLDAWHRI